MDISSNQGNASHDDNASRDGENSSSRKQRMPLGTECFDAEARESFGRNVRLFMSLTDGSAIPPISDSPDKAMPDDAPAIARRLRQVGQDIASGMADQLELLVRFDDLEGWKISGSRHCVAWMNSEMGISLQLGWEYLRVGRRLRTLPIIKALFRGGRLTWSIVRLLSRVADESNEALLCHAALDASVSDVERLCLEYRWQQDADEDEANGENFRSLKQIEARSFTWGGVSNGNTLIKLSLPPEVAEAFLNSVEQSLAQLDENDASMQQRRADAAVLMAENSLHSVGRDMATADRYQVIVSVDASELNANRAIENTPPKRPVVRNAGPIATETARRIACDCSIATIIHKHGEPVDIGRKSRLWPPAMARAIKNRDQHCQHPGCTQTRHLQIHHIHHWADGGSTCVDNGVCICAYHHSLLHEGGYRIERVSDSKEGLEEQFIRQQATSQTFDQIERQLRNSQESFQLVSQLSPTRFRFRVVNREGQDIRDISDFFKEPCVAERRAGAEKDFHSTHVDSDLDPDSQSKGFSSWPGVAEMAGKYRIAEACT
ncbi:HNH endonuclease signature motif containing protein [Granulosicoccus antarcticus]|uniref:HNH nuclease domain-containing protein n=1 Tax=Granulosicoccus antarcticus IMCC3135 TaxID=1192854 RepID=A0A2Z2NV18_9GAMM|nr:HNH endonuclease signature motif containing protein [Granulosicoccus antarcticus]ASJ75316.1 hypothetical protein IMCC3135_26305 [Granulosicoccus antarcticus IMCC3135]